MNHCITGQSTSGLQRAMSFIAGRWDICLYAAQLSEPLSQEMNFLSFSKQIPFYFPLPPSGGPSCILGEREASEQRQCGKSCSWCKRHNLNVKKTREIIFNSRSAGDQSPVLISGQGAKQATTHKYLGVYLDPPLQRTNHVEYACSRPLESTVRIKAWWFCFTERPLNPWSVEE